MYVIAMYDIGEKRVARMLKLCRQYLNWIQNSVFEGELSSAQLESLKYEALKIMEAEDSFIVFKSRQEKWLEKEIIGNEKASVDNFL